MKIIFKRVSHSNTSLPHFGLQQRRLGKKENADLYVKYAEFVTKELGDRIDTVCTINEANLTACFAIHFLATLNKE